MGNEFAFQKKVCKARTLILKELMPEGIKVQKTRTHSAERAGCPRGADILEEVAWELALKQGGRFSRRWGADGIIGQSKNINNRDVLDGCGGEQIGGQVGL